MPPIELFFGAGGIGKGMISHNWTTPEETSELLNSLHELQLQVLDSGASYPPGAPFVTETLLGQAKAAEKGFIIDSKILPRLVKDPDTQTSGAFSLTEENIDASVKKSLELLGVEKVNVLYAHTPDPETPIEESAKAFDKHFRAGHFKQLGLSNYSTAAVKEWLDLCDEKGYVKPTVYQGQYNALQRHSELALYPLLKKHGVKIAVYSPLAGGFLTGKVSLQTPETDLSKTRWTPGHPLGYPEMFDHPNIHAAMIKFINHCKKAGISSTEASLRWLMHHSVLREGDALILGATRVDQLTKSVDFCKKGPLDEDILNAMEELWDAAKEGTAATAIA